MADVELWVTCQFFTNHLYDFFYPLNCMYVIWLRFVIWNLLVRFWKSDLSKIINLVTAGGKSSLLFLQKYVLLTQNAFPAKMHYLQIHDNSFWLFPTRHGCYNSRVVFVKEGPKCRRRLWFEWAFYLSAQWQKQEIMIGELPKPRMGKPTSCKLKLKNKTLNTVIPETTRRQKAREHMAWEAGMTQRNTKKRRGPLRLMSWCSCVLNNIMSVSILILKYCVKCNYNHNDNAFAKHGSNSPRFKSSSNHSCIHKIRNLGNPDRRTKMYFLFASEEGKDKFLGQVLGSSLKMAWTLFLYFWKHVYIWVDEFWIFWPVWKTSLWMILKHLSSKQNQNYDYCFFLHKKGICLAIMLQTVA